MLFIISVVVLSISGCSSENITENTNAETKKSVTINTNDETVPDTSEKIEVTFNYKNNPVKLPMKYDEFKKLTGYRFKNEPDDYDKLSPGYTRYYKLVNDEKDYITCCFANTNLESNIDDLIPVEDCVIMEIVLQFGFEEEICTDKNITFTNKNVCFLDNEFTDKDVINMFGKADEVKPSYFNEYETEPNGNYYVYKDKDNSCSMRLKTNQDTERVNYISYLCDGFEDYYV